MSCIDIYYNPQIINVDCAQCQTYLPGIQINGHNHNQLNIPAHTGWLLMHNASFDANGCHVGAIYQMTWFTRLLHRGTVTAPCYRCGNFGALRSGNDDYLIKMRNPVNSCKIKELLGNYPVIYNWGYYRSDRWRVCQITRHWGVT